MNIFLSEIVFNLIDIPLIKKIINHILAANFDGF